jgi:peptidoglycan L-alanyl-D-glutamate endopeptidase CwlK
VKTKLFARRAKGRLIALLALATVAVCLHAPTAVAQTQASQTPAASQAKSLDGAGQLGTLSQALYGHSYARVAALQRDLDASGVSPGPIDGIYGPKTEQAVSQYQRQNGLTVDGKAGIETRSQLYYGGADGVKQLQGDLAGQGLDPGPQDGLYGPQTKQAVAGFQRQNALRVDGIAGPQTLSGLRQVTAKGQAPVTPAAPAPPQAQPLPQSGGAQPKAPAKPADHSLAVIIANALFAIAVFAIARVVFRRRERQRKEVESHLVALAEEEEERYRAQRTPRSRRRRPARMTSTPWTDSTSEIGGSRTASYSWPNKRSEGS